MTSRTFTSSKYGIDVTISSSGCPSVAITAVAFGAVEGCAERRLRHLVGVNGFFSALAAESRKRVDCDLSLWWSECHDTEQFDRIAQPDGLGVSEEAGVRLALCLAWDRSTEPLERLGKKLTSYEDLQIASGLVYRIVFCFGHPPRETGVRAADCGDPGVPAPGGRGGATSRRGSVYRR